MNALSRSGLLDQQSTGVMCVECVMDQSDPDIAFDSKGVCNHCLTAERELAAIRLTPEESASRLQDAAREIAKGRTAAGYDSIIGLSGGVDSSFMAVLAADLGLRPLAVHLDNGWNSEIAVSNIRGVIEACDIHLATLVIDWREFRDLQRAFIKAHVVDIEMVTDHAIMAAMFRLAGEHGIRSILSGTNVATEHGMPRSWVWNKQDRRNIEAIHRRFGAQRLETYPRMGMLKSILARHLGFGPRYIELLNIVNFRKGHATAVLAQRTGWRDYGGKHYESVFTKFYQAYILPTKFGIDKRRVHFSALIRNGEMDRPTALELLQKPLYDAEELRRDKEFVLKKLGFSEPEFDDIMRAPPVPHDRYPSDKQMRDAIKAVVSLIRIKR